MRDFDFIIMHQFFLEIVLIQYWFLAWYIKYRMELCIEDKRFLLPVITEMLCCGWKLSEWLLMAYHMLNEKTNVFSTSGSIFDYCSGAAVFGFAALNVEALAIVIKNTI